MSIFRKSGMVNVKMVITEEKILSNIDKIQKLINPNSKKQIVQLEEDSYFKDLVESVKTYLLEYPKKKNFPKNVYKAAYELVEYATSEFEDNTRKIEKLIRKREKNIKLGSVLKDVTEAVKAHAKNWKEIVEKLSKKYPADISEALYIIGNTKDKNSEAYIDADKLIQAKIKNLEQNKISLINNLTEILSVWSVTEKRKILNPFFVTVTSFSKSVPQKITLFMSPRISAIGS